MKIRISDWQKYRYREDKERERGRKGDRVGKRKEGNTVAKGYNPRARLESLWDSEALSAI